jgi:hypothetical protein
LPGAGQRNHQTGPGGSLQTRFHVIRMGLTSQAHRFIVKCARRGVLPIHLRPCSRHNQGLAGSDEWLVLETHSDHATNRPRESTDGVNAKLFAPSSVGDQQCAIVGHSPCSGRSQISDHRLPIARRRRARIQCGERPASVRICPPAGRPSNPEARRGWQPPAGAVMKD